VSEKYEAKCLINMFSDSGWNFVGLKHWCWPWTTNLTRSYQRIRGWPS